MQFPDFFRDVPRLRLRDPLALFLGAAEGGVLEYGYEDAVKLAGHSCPTVASAYRLTALALSALYRDELPERGGVRVDFRERFEDGVTGVVAGVVTLVTGAAHDGGFKGIAGRHARRGLQHFAASMPHALRFTRLDCGAAVEVEAHLARVPADPQMPALLAKAAAADAGDDELRAFAGLWQDRVRRLLVEHWDDPEVFRLHPVR